MSNSYIHNNVFRLAAQETVVDSRIVVSVESTLAETIIAVRYKLENGYVLVRTYQLTENEKKEVSASPGALTRIIKKKRISEVFTRVKNYFLV